MRPEAQGVRVLRGNGGRGTHLAKQDLDHHLLGLVPHVHKARHSERAALHDRLSLCTMAWGRGGGGGGY